MSIARRSAVMPVCALLGVVVLGLTVLAFPRAGLADLAVAVEANPDPARPAEIVDVRITVTNDGLAAETDVLLESPIPADIASGLFNGLLSHGGTCPGTVVNNGSCDVGELATWDLGTIPAGGGITVSFPPIVAAGTLDGTLISFEANVSDLSGLRATTSATVEVQGAPALEIAVEEDRDPVGAGEALTYTVRFGHVAPARIAPGTVLSLELPAGAAFVSATDGGVFAAGTVEWALGTLLPGDAGQRQVTVDVDGALVEGSLLSARASIADTDGEDAEAVAVTRVEDALRLDLAMLTRPDPVRPGEILEVEITVTNPNLFPVAGALLEVRMPEALTGTSNGLLSDGGTCPGTAVNNGSCDARERATWDLGTLAAGSGLTVTIPPVVAGTTPDGTLIGFDAHLIDDTGAQRTLQRTVHVDSAPALELAVAEDRDPVDAGESLTYTLRFGHVATATVSPGATLSFELPAGTAFVSATDGGTLSGSRVDWVLGTLLPGEAGERRVTLDVDAGALEGALLHATALVEDTDGSEARMRTVTRVEASVPLELAMLTRPDPVRPGEMLEVEATVTNSGFVPVAGVVLEVRVPEELSRTANGLLTDDGTCPGTAVNNSSCDPREFATWDLGTIEPGSGITVVLPPLVAGGTPDATLISLDGRLRDGADLQRTLQRTVHLHSALARELASAEDRDPVDAGESLTYTLRFGHVATATVSPGATLSFELPAGTAFVSATDGGTLSDSRVEWALGTLLPGVAGERRVTLDVDAGALEGALLHATALLEDADGNKARMRTVTRVEASVPLELAMLTRPDPVRPGEILDVELTVTNRGFLPVAGIVLEARMPEETARTSNALLSGDGACPGTVVNNSSCDPREFATWDLGTIEPGSGVTVDVPPLVAAGTPDATLISVDARLREGAGAQRTLQRTVHVDGDPALELALAESLDPVAPGEGLTYTLDLGHVNTARFAPGAVLRLELPDGVALVSATGGGAAAAGNAVEWALGTLDPGGSAELQATAQVGAGVPEATVLEARASIVDTDAPPQQALARTATRVEAGVPLELSALASPDPVAPGFVANVELTVTNAGALALGGVLLEARIPQEIGLLPVGDLDGGGTCPGTVVNNSRCEGREFATWDLGSLDPGEEVTVNLSAPIAVATGEAGIVDFEVFVVGDGGARRTLQTSVVADNCPQIPNADQANSDAEPRGDACLCGDQTGDGSLNVSDILAINAAIFDTGLVTPLCDANNDGACNIADILAVNAEIFSPNETTICAFQTCPDLLRSCP